jgi:hypothetical protein
MEFDEITTASSRSLVMTSSMFSADIEYQPRSAIIKYPSRSKIKNAHI